MNENIKDIIITNNDNAQKFVRHFIGYTDDNSPNKDRDTFNYLSSYIINYLSEKGINNITNFDFYISCIFDDVQAILPIKLRIVLDSSKIYNVYKIYKIQDSMEEDITDKKSILVTPSYNTKTSVRHNVNFFNVIFYEQKEQGGGKLKKGQKKIKSKKSVVSQNKENKYKDVLGKRMKIYEKPDSRKEFVRYKGELVELVEYKKSMKEIAKKQNAKK